MLTPTADLADNCLATLSVLEACRRGNSRARIVYASTRQVYGRVEEIPVTEESAVRPTDINGIHKRAAEEYLRLYAGQFGLRTAVLRLTNTFGPRMDVRNGDRGFAAVLIGRALRGEPLSIYGTGEQVRDFNYVDDVVAALRLAADLDDLSGGVWNLGDPWPCTVREFVDRLGQILPVSIRQVPFPEDLRKIEIGDYAGDYTKFHNATGWSPQVTIEEGLRRTVAYFRSHQVELLPEADDREAESQEAFFGADRESA
jgi:nucleoside-diphosphate-sugar epimerase